MAASLATQFDKHIAFQKQWSENTAAYLDLVGDAGEYLQKASDEGKVQRLREAALKIIELHNLANDNTEVLQRLQRSYVHSPTAETDFSRLLSEGIEERQATSRFNAADHSLYKELQEAIGGDASQPTQDDEDEDVMIAGGTQAELAPNSKCPLSGRALMAIEDPVEDSKGFVYEKSYIEQYISKNRGQSMYVKCPEHGTQHKVAEKDLKPAKKVMKAKRRNKHRPGGGTQAQQARGSIVEL